MDPEVLEEFQQRQAKMNKIQSSIQSGDFRAGYYRFPLNLQSEPLTNSATVYLQCYLLKNLLGGSLRLLSAQASRRRIGPERTGSGDSERPLRGLGPLLIHMTKYFKSH